MSNLTFCGYCGSEVSGNHGFCTACGKAKSKSEPESLPITSTQEPAASIIHPPESFINKPAGLMKQPVAIAITALAVVVIVAAVVVGAILLSGDSEPDTDVRSTESSIAARWGIETDNNSDIGERWGVQPRDSTGTSVGRGVEREIQQALDQVAEAYSRGDISAVIGIFGSDANAVFGTGLDIVGGMAGFDINEMSQAMFGFANLFGDELGIEEMPSMTMTVNSVTEMSDGLVSVNVTTTMSVSGTTETETGELIMRNLNGEWVFALDMMR